MCSIGTEHQPCNKLRGVTLLGTRRFWRSYVLHPLAALGAIAGALGLYDVLKPGAVAQSDFPFALVSGGVAIAYGTYMGWPRPIRQSYPVANTEIRLVEGDLFDQDVNLVIGMSNTFDTEIPHIISADSVQGQFLDRIYCGDRSALDEDLGNALAGTASSGSIEKPGKTKLYDVGTIASIRTHRRFFFCVAYAKMNEANEARGTVEGLWRSLDNLWSEVRAVSNGDPVVLPVLGGGQARMAQILPCSRLYPTHCFLFHLGLARRASM